MSHKSPSGTLTQLPSKMSLTPSVKMKKQSLINGIQQIEQIIQPSEQDKMMKREQSQENIVTGILQSLKPIKEEDTKSPRMALLRNRSDENEIALM